MGRTAVAGMLIALLLLLTGCGQPVSGNSGDAGSSGFPFKTAQDWVTYSDYLLELTAESERTLQPDENERFEGEGVFRREFRLDVDAVRWSRPRAARRPPTGLTWTSGGWQFRNGDLNRRTPIEEPNQLQVGRHYLAICTLAPDATDTTSDGDAWACSRILLVAGVVTRPEDVRDDGSEPIWRDLVGLTPAEAGRLLAGTAPDPAAAPYMAENAYDRYQLVAAAREATASPR